jgi:hypothetical protein
MKRLIPGLVAALLAFPAWAQLPGGSDIQINRTPVIGGTALQCLYVTSANKVGNQACGAGTAANVTVGTTTVTGGTTGQFLYDNGGLIGETAGMKWAAPIATITAATTTTPDYQAAITGDTTPRAAFGVNSTDVPRLSFGPGNAVRDTFLMRGGAATFQLGAADAAAPVAQNLQVQSVVTGTSNTAGTNFTVKGSIGTGTGVGGSIIFQTAAAGSTGSTPNSLAAALTINSAGQTLATDGTAALPSYGFASEPGTGWWRRSTAIAGLSLNGTQRVDVTATQFKLGSGTSYVFTNGTVTGTVDTGLSRVSGAVVGVGNGTAGTVGGQVQALTFYAGPGTALTAGGASTMGFTASSTANFGVFFGSGAPTFSAAKGSLYLRSDGSGIADRAFINTNGSTTWTNLVTGG